MFSDFFCIDDIIFKDDFIHFLSRIPTLSQVYEFYKIFLKLTCRC